MIRVPEIAWLKHGLHMAHAPVVMERVSRPVSSYHLPSCRVGEPQRIVLAIRIPVEALCAFRALHIGIHRKEAAHHRVVAPPVHVDEAEGRHVLVASIAAVEHWLCGGTSSPSLGVTLVAPGVVGKLLLQPADFICDGRPTAEVVFEDVALGFHVFVT